MNEQPPDDNPYVPVDGANMTEEELMALWENASAEDLFEAHTLWKQRLMVRADQLQAAIDDHNTRCVHQIDRSASDADYIALQQNRAKVDRIGREFVREKYLWHMAAGAGHERAAELAVQLAYWRGI